MYLPWEYFSLFVFGSNVWSVIILFVVIWLEKCCKCIYGNMQCLCCYMVICDRGIMGNGAGAICLFVNRTGSHDTHHHATWGNCKRGDLFFSVLFYIFFPRICSCNIEDTHTHAHVDSVCECSLNAQMFSGHAHEILWLTIERLCFHDHKVIRTNAN